MGMRNLIGTLIKTAPLIHPVSTPEGVLKRAKYCLRGLAFARHTKEWFELLQTPELALVVRNHPYLFHKLQRPYLNRTLSTRQRLETLKQHYHFVTTSFSPSVRENVYALSGLLLATSHMAKLGDFELRLRCSHREKEGDFLIGLRHKDTGIDAFTMSFSVASYGPGGKEIFIGGLQGHKSADKDFVVSMTRSLHGLRPKALLIFSLQQLAACWGITRLRAVSDDKHIYRHFQKRRVLSASYDEFWGQCGGTLSSDGMFDLPVTFIPRTISTIKVNKRQMYKRRYVLLAKMARQIWVSTPLSDDSRPVFDWTESQSEGFLDAPENEDGRGETSKPKGDRLDFQAAFRQLNAAVTEDQTVIPMEAA